MDFRDLEPIYFGDSLVQRLGNEKRMNKALESLKEVRNHLTGLENLMSQSPSSSISSTTLPTGKWDLVFGASSTKKVNILTPSVISSEEVINGR